MIEEKSPKLISVMVYFEISAVVYFEISVVAYFVISALLSLIGSQKKKSNKVAFTKFLHN